MKGLGWLLALSLAGFVSSGAQTSDRRSDISSGYREPQAIHGTVSYHIYKTAIGKNLPGGREDFYVYTPPGYDPKSSTKYPVLYLLHGFGQHASGWIKDGDANLTLDKLIAQRKARPMIVVMPHCYGDFKFFLDGLPIWAFPKNIDENVNLFSRMLFSEIIPQVEADYNVSKKREDRAIVGLSMGGLEALTIGLENPREFAWVGGFSSVLPRVRRESPTFVKPGMTDFQLLWMSWGVSDFPPIVNENRRVIAELEEQGLSVTAHVTQGGHAWPVWRYNFSQFAPLLFQRN